MRPHLCYKDPVCLSLKKLMRIHLQIIAQLFYFIYRLFQAISGISLFLMSSMDKSEQNSNSVSYEQYRWDMVLRVYDPLGILFLNEPILHVLIFFSNHHISLSLHSA